MAKQTEGGTWINVNSNEEKGHVNIYDNDPRGEHDSIHININYDNNSFQITEKEDGEKSVTDCKCFLTTACMKRMYDEFDDNCEELTILRWFRDNFVSKEDIEYYYAVAPIIIENIELLENKYLIYNYIYESIIDVCVSAIKKGDYNFAYNRYRNGILILEEKFARVALNQRLIRILDQKNI